MPWVKLHTELLRDPRLYRLPESAQLHFFKLLMVAGQCDADGALQMAGVWLTCSEIAWHMNADADATCSSLDALAASGLLERSGDGWAVAGWLERQRTRQEDQRAQWRERQARARTKSDAEPKAEKAKKPEKTAPEPVKEDASREDKKTVTRDSRVSHAARERVRERGREVLSTTKGTGETEKLEQAKTAGAVAPRPRDVLFDAVAEVTKSNPALQGSHIAKVANRLRDIGATPEQIKRFGQWFAVCDFRGMKGDSPMLENVMQLWQRSVEWDGARPKLPTGAPPRSNGRTFARGQVQYTDEQRKAAEERARRELAGEEVE